MSDETPIALIAHYQQLVARYEALRQAIDRLLTESRQRSKTLSPEELQQYRVMARERDDLFSEMREIQRQLTETTEIPRVPPTGEEEN